jgi:peptidoglycan/LPS O-acetylase OafA/YrhL
VPSSTRPRHLWEIDLIRVLTFTAVVAVHAISATQRASNEVAQGFIMLLHFTREGFFAISGFVLVYSAIGKAIRPLSFWRRRLPLVGIPYVAWSAIYYWLTLATSAHGSWSWSTFGTDLLYGTAEYHLYFLVVTIQLYFVFPALVRFLRATARHAVAILLSVGVANLAWLGLLQYGHQHGWLYTHAYELLPTYAVYVLAGGYAALHREALQAYLATHRWQLLAVAAGSLAVALGVYAAQLSWMAPTGASAVTQPANLASCVAMILLLCVLGDRWVAAGTPGRKTIGLASEISFGVYLAHPLILQFFLDHGLGLRHQVIPSPLATVAAIAGAIVGAAALALLVRRTPLALPLTGRPRVRVRAHTNGGSPRSAAASSAVPGAPIRPPTLTTASLDRAASSS